MKKGLSKQLGGRIGPFDMAHYLYAFNEKHGINQTKFDDTSFDNDDQAAH